MLGLFSDRVLYVLQETSKPLVGLIGVCWVGHVTLYGNCMRKPSQCTCQWLETDSSNHIALQKVLLCLGLSYFKCHRVPLPLTLKFQSTSLFLCLFLSILPFDPHCHRVTMETIRYGPECFSTFGQLCIGFIKCIFLADQEYEVKWVWLKELLHLSTDGSVIWPHKASCHSCAVTHTETYGLNDTAYTVRAIWETDTGCLHYSHSFNAVLSGTQGLKSQTKYELSIIPLAMVCFQVFRITTLRDTISQMTFSPNVSV